MDKQAVAVGIHTLRDATGLSAVRITPAVIADLDKWIKESQTDSVKK